MSSFKPYGRPSTAHDDGEAFLPDLVRTASRASRARHLDDDADALAEEFVASATSAEDAFEAARNEFVLEEIGGPFVDEPDVVLGLRSRAQDA